MATSNPSTELTVWGVGTSRALRAHWAVRELGLSYRTEQIQSRSGQTQTEAYTRLDPRQKIPLLQDGDFILSESSAIITYLGEHHDSEGERLVPRDPRQRARYNEWVSFICMELDATSLYVLRRHEGLPQIYGESPVANAAARAYFAKMIDAAAVRFGTDRDYVLGDRFSGADILLMTILTWIQGLEPPIAAPSVFDAYHDRIAARPAYQAAVIANTPEGPRAP